MANEIRVTGYSDDEHDQLRRALTMPQYRTTFDGERFEVAAITNERVDPFEAARQLVRWVGRVVGVGSVARVAVSFDHFEAPEPHEPTGPAVPVIEPGALIGVGELAELLDVSKQRASAIASKEGAPQPLARLATGPVWHRGQWADEISRRSRSGGPDQSPEPQPPHE